VGADARLGKSLFERDALIEQLKERGTSVRRELPFSLTTFTFLLSRCTRSQAFRTVTAGTDA
jgi:hypothetical protein